MRHLLIRTEKLREQRPPGKAGARLFRKAAAGLILTLAGWGFFVSGLQAGSFNDNFSAASDLSLVLVSTTGGKYIVNPATTAIIASNTTETGENTSPCATISATAWYRYLSTAAFLADLQTVGSNYDTVMAVYRGDSLATLISTGCNDDIGGGVLQSRLNNVLFSPNATYYIQVGGYNSASMGGNLVLTSTLTAIPFDGAAPTAGISKPANGAVLDSLSHLSGTAADTGSVDPGVASVQIQIVRGSDGFFWDGTQFGATSVFLTPDFSTGTSVTWRYDSVPDWVDGSTYTVQVRAKDNSGNLSGLGSSSFLFQLPLTPPNDSSTFAFSFGALPISTAGTNLTAVGTLEKTPSCPSAGGDKDVWFLYNSTIGSAGNAMQIDTIGSDFDTVLAVWNNAGGAPGSELGCNDDSVGTQSRLSLPLTTAGTYFIQVFAYGSGSGGNYKLNVAQLPTDLTAPSTISDLQAFKGSSPGQVKLHWTAVGDDGATGTAAAYDIRYSTTGPVLSSFAFSSATQVQGAPAPSAAGAQESFLISGLPERTSVWFNIEARDEVFNYGALSLSNSPMVVVPGTPPTAANLAPSSASVIPGLAYADEVQVAAAGSNDVEMSGFCNGNKFGALQGDLWYQFVSTASGIALAANTFNSSVDTILQVWQDTGGVGNTNQFVNIACNDNAAGFGSQSRVRFNLLSGASYFFQIVRADAGTVRFQAGLADSVKPGAVTSLAAVPGANAGGVDLSWVEPADDDYAVNSGTVSRYFVRYSSVTPINMANWSPVRTTTGPVLDIETTFAASQRPPDPVGPGTLRTMTVRNLTPGVSYYFSVRSLDQAGNLSDTSNSPFAPAAHPALVPGDGEGTAELKAFDGSPLTEIPVSSQVVVNIRFTVGDSSMSAQGRFAVRIPDYWTPPQVLFSTNPGFVSVSTITPDVHVSDLLATIDPADPRIVNLTTLDKLDAGDTLNLRYRGWTQYSKQNGVVFAVQSRGSDASRQLPIPVQPVLNVVPGPAAYVGFTDWNYITLGSSQASPGMTLEPKDTSWQGTTAGKDLQIRIFALYWDTQAYAYRYDDSASFSKDDFTRTLSSFTVSTSAFSAAQWYPSLSSTTATVTYHAFTIPNGSNGEKLYYRTALPAGVGARDGIVWMEYNSDFSASTAAGNAVYTTSRWFRIRSSSQSFNNFTVTPRTITPDNDNNADFATIGFDPTVPDTQWRVRIGTDPIFTQTDPLPPNAGQTGGAAGVAPSSITVLFDWWGFGQPRGVTWYGTDFSGSVVPNSTAQNTYYVRVEDAGGSAVRSATVTVQSSYISVFVTTGTAGCGGCLPVGAPGAQVTANGGSQSVGFAYRQKTTGSDGKAKLWGLNSANASGYQLSANWYDPSTGKNFTQFTTGVTAGDPPPSVATMTLTEPTLIRVHATLPADGVRPGYDQWGNVSVSDAGSGFPAGSGPLHFQAGGAESDSGWSASGAPSSWTVIAVQPGGTYRVRSELSGFGVVVSSDLTVNGRYDYNIQLVRKPQVTGYVVFPATQPYGTWVSIEATKSGARFPTAFGGSYIPGANDFSGGRTTGAYVMDLDTGAYTFRARAYGLGSVSSAAVTVTASGIGSLLSGDVNSGNAVVQNGLNFVFGPPSAGILGTVNIVGNTQNLPSYMVQNGSFTLYINAFNNANYSYASAQVQLPQSATLSSGTYQIPALEDGTYQVRTFLPGFEVDPPGAQTVTVASSGTLNLTLKQYTGKLKMLFATASPPADYSNITLNLNGPDGTVISTDNITTLPGFTALASSAQVVVSQLGSGFYDASVYYKGHQSSKKINVVNDSSTLPTVDFSPDLTNSVFAVSGTVNVQSFTFGVTAASTGTRIDTVADLVNSPKIGYESLNIGTGAFVLPIARIEAVPKRVGDNQTDFHNRDLVHVVGPQGPCNGPDCQPQFGFGDLRFGAISASGTWRIDNLPPGVYTLRHPVNLDRNAPAGTYNNSLGASFEANTADVVYEEKTIYVSSAGAVQVIEPQDGDLQFTYAAGAEVTGRILLPSDIPTDTRFITLEVLNKREEILNYQVVYLNGPSVPYKISNLGPGDYTITVQDEYKGDETNWNQYAPCSGDAPCNRKKYVAKPLSVSITGGNVSGQDIQLQRAGTVEGKLAVVRVSSDNTKSTELITSNNRSLLPGNFRIYAFSDTAGRSAQGEIDQTCSNGNCQIYIDPTKGTFRLSYLLPDTDYKVSFTQDNYQTSNLGQGKLNLVSQDIQGVSVGAGQTLNVGTVVLGLGLSVNGSVRDLSGQPIPNLLIQAVQSGSGNSHDQNNPETYTDAKGSFTLTGLDPDQRYYDFIFGARSSDEGSIDFGGLGNDKYAQKTKRNVDVRNSTQTVDMVMEEGLGSIRGRVITADGGRLSDPFGNGGESGFPVADIVVNKQGNVPTDNPIGDIEVTTDFDGNFVINRLSTGTYDIYAFSLGYGVKKTSASVGFTQTDIGTVTLPTGLSLSGNIRKPDGSLPTTSDVDTLVAATTDFSEISIAALSKNDSLATVDSYVLAGLKPGTTYTLLMFNQNNDQIVPPERFPAGGSGVAITSNTANFNLTFVRSSPEVFMRGRKTGNPNEYLFEFDLTSPLRAKTDGEKSDAYWQSIVTKGTPSGSTNNGALSADPEDTNPITPDRGKVFVLYTAPAADTKVTVRFKAPTVALQPGSTAPFVVDETFDYFLGLDGQKITRVNSLQGGTISLDGDSSQVDIPAGAFNDTNGNALDVSSSVSVGLQKADVSVGTAVAHGALAFNPSGTVESNLPPVLTKAVEAIRSVKQNSTAPAPTGSGGIRASAQVAADVTGANVLGSFYDFFLPAGVSRSLAKNARVTLQYTSTMPADELNVYFYNDTASTVTTTGGVLVPPNSYGIEDTSKTVDSVNNTVSVSVNHFTVYVVVNSTEPMLIGPDIVGSSSFFLTNSQAYTGSEIEAFNFPNPFDPNNRGFSFTATKTSGGQTLRSDGATVVRYALPGSLGSSPVHVSLEIFDVAGELVKRLDYGDQTPGLYYYADWDGRNEDGQTVASGVYIARLSVAGAAKPKIFKMAVIK